MIFRKGSHEPVHEASSLEQEQGGDAEDLVFRSRGRAFIEVHLHEFDGPGEFGGEFGKNGHQAPAVPAPWRPEQHEDRSGKREYFAAECAVVGIDGTFRKLGRNGQGGAAPAADRAIPRA